MWIDKVNGLIRDYDRIKNFVFFGPENYDIVFDRIRCSIWSKGCITYVDSFSYAKIKTDSDDGSPLEKTLTVRNIVILIKSVFNESYKQYN